MNKSLYWICGVVSVCVSLPVCASRVYIDNAIQARAVKYQLVQVGKSGELTRGQEFIYTLQPSDSLDPLYLYPRHSGRAVGIVLRSVKLLRHGELIWQDTTKQQRQFNSKNACWAVANGAEVLHLIGDSRQSLGFGCAQSKKINHRNS